MERHEYELMARLEDRMWWYRALHAQIADACRGLELPSEATVLDAGCGTGGLLKRLAQFRPSWHLRGVEWDGEACAWAKRKLERGTILQGSVHHLPFAEGVFDLVISADVLCHANVDPGRALHEMRRVLKPGGRFIMSLPAYQWMLSAHDLQVHNARRFTARQAKTLLSQAGFGGSRTWYWNSLLFPLMVLRRLTTRGGEGASDVQDYPPLLDRFLGGVLTFERLLSAGGLRLPFGGSVAATAVKKDE